MKEKVQRADVNEAAEKKPFEEPELTYVPPKLEENGRVEEVTLQGFFGTFSP